jgi:hypothetical protein
VVQVIVDSVVNLGAYQFTLSYDPAVVSYNPLPTPQPTPTPFLGTTARDTVCLGPFVAPGSLTFMCNSTGDAPPGPNGTGVLRDVDFLGSFVGGTSPLHLSGVVLADIEAMAKLPVLVLDGSITVNGPTPTATATGTATATPTSTNTPTPSLTPTPTPTRTPTPSPTRTPTPTPTRTPTPTPTATYTPIPQTTIAAGTCADIDGDGGVHVSDIILVLLAFGSANPQADFDHNGVITVADILFVIRQYGTTC